MTDNEIAKALECCSSPKINACDDCPFHERCYNNDEFIEKEALDLIKRQKAEIERFKEECSCLGCENEWLKAHYKEIKTEAVKECIEKIKTRSSSCVASKDGIVIAGSRIYTISEVKLYEIEKEMVGE